MTLAQSHPSNPPPPSQISDATRPEYRLDQSDEDWGGLCNSSTRGQDLWDPLKCVALGRPSWYVSFGGQLRGQYELFRNYNWGSGPQDGNGYYLNRVLAHSDFHFDQRIRVFAEFESGLELGRNAGPRPSIDEDKLDLSQLFLELTPATHHDKTPISLRIGRQELYYGDGSLVATRELNVRRPFDGVRLILRPHDLQVDIFAAKPVLTRNNIFDDAPDPGQILWGVWATKPKGPLFVKRLDLYYLGLDRKNGQYDDCIARERRNTLGFNTSEGAANLSFAQEGDLQFGTFGAERLRAWKVAQGIVCSLPQMRYQPTLELQGAISSGDGGVNDSHLDTFNPLYPKGLYYGYMVFTSGALNAMVIHPSFTMQLSKNVSLNGDSFSMWRHRTTDGLYSQSGMFLRTGQTTDARYIGSTQDINIHWRVDRHTAVTLLGAYYEVGPYLRETQPPAKNTAYFAGMLSYTF